MTPMVCTPELVWALFYSKGEKENDRKSWIWTFGRKAAFSSNKSDVLIDEDGVTVGVYKRKTCGTGCALVGFFYDLHALFLQAAL